nr:MAG TPA: BNR/Asp-box repeat protein [Bacteriophage sp.]
MIHISNAYKKAIYGRSDWYPSARVTFLDGTVLNLGRSEFLISGNNIVDGAGTQSLPLGNVVSRKITVKLYNADDRYRVHSFLGAKITLYKSISTDIGDLTIKSGTYTVIDPESYGDTVSFSAYDDAYKLDRDYTTHLTYPLSLKDILKDSCRTCGVQMDVTSFSDDNITVKEKPTNTTHRQVIGWIAMIAGGNAWMNADNHLQISQYDMSLFDNIADIDGGWFDDPRQNYDGGQFETDMISEKYSTYAEMSGGTFSEDISEYYYDDLDWSSEKYSSGSSVDGGWFDDGLELLTDDSYGIMYRSVERKQRNTYQLIGKKGNLFLLKNGNVLGVHSVDVEEASGYILTDATNVYTSGDILDDGNFKLVDNFHFLTQWKTGLTTGVEPIVITGIQTTENEKTYTYGSEGYILSIENSLIKDKSLLVNTVGAKLTGVSFMNFSGEHLSYPLADFMDLAYVIDRNGKVSKTILTDITFNFLGFTSLKCSAENAIRNSSKYVTSETKAIQKASAMTDKKIGKYDEAVQSLTALMTQGMGFFKTEKIQDDKSIVFYLHNKEKLEDSNIIWKMVGDAFAVSTDGGKTWNAGLDSNGNAVVNVLSAVGINCDWIHSGTLTLGGYNNTNGHCAIENADGKVVGTLGVNGYYSNDPKDQYAIRVNNGQIDVYGSKGTLVGTVKYVQGAGDGSEGIEMYVHSGNRYSAVSVSTNGRTAIWGDSVLVATDKLITGGTQAKTGRAVFSDGSYLDYRNGYLIGGRTASGTKF